MSTDAAIDRIETELAGWTWSVFARIPGEDYQAHVWSTEDRPDPGPEVYANAATPAEALIEALERAKRGEFYAGK